ncbi:MAG: FtsH protease activity modulator HflK [Holosporaceae bacterium]|jgi:membrane protease subunit HflK|nr:FtsH protease activity modulator HflK [Holosporaceae bacterium]
MSVKNPWDNDDNPWKKKPKAGDFVSDFVERFKKITISFGNSGSGKGGGGYSSFRFLYFIVGAIILYLLSGFYQVQHDQRGVVLRFGRWVRTVGPGLQYILPYPFEKIILQRVTKVNQIDIGSFFRNQQEESLVLTGDSNLANISFSILWKIKEDGVEDYLFCAKFPEITVRAVGESVMREIVGQTPFTYVQTEGRGDIQRKVRESLQQLMDEYRIGVEIVRVELLRVEPPPSVIDSFRDVERAQAEQQKEKNKAEAYDRDTRARTRGLLAEKLNKGEAKKRSIIETARGAVARFVSVHSQFKLSPAIVGKLLYLNTMRDIYKDVNKIVVDSEVKAVPLLPITQLNRLLKTIGDEEK